MLGNWEHWWKEFRKRENTEQTPKILILPRTARVLDCCPTTHGSSQLSCRHDQPTGLAISNIGRINPLFQPTELSERSTHWSSNLRYWHDHPAVLANWTVETINPLFSASEILVGSTYCSRHEILVESTRCSRHLRYWYNRPSVLFKWAFDMIIINLYLLQ